MIGKRVSASVAGFSVKPDASFSLLIKNLPESEGENGDAVVVTTDPAGRGSFTAGTLVLAGSIPK